ncbi:MAG: hypothetical protein ACFFCF_08745 [Promethearchaeota archaeon]
MKNSKIMNPRSHLWFAGILILLGTMLITFTGIVQIYWWNLNPPPSGWIVESDQYYHGNLSASNSSVGIQFGALNSASAIEFREMYTNNTPITISLYNQPNDVIFQLVNLTAPQDQGPLYIEILGDGVSETPLNVTIQRVTIDVQFRLRIIWKHFIAYSLAPPPYYLFIAGYILGGLLITTGFYLIEHTIRYLH